MINTHISELMSRDDLSVLKDSETLGSFFKMKNSSRSNCYVVNKENILQGMIDDRAVLEYTAPLMAIVDQNNSRNLMERIRNIPLSNIVRIPASTLSMKNTLHEVLKSLHTESCSALPVLDDKGVLLGEITINSLFQRLDSDVERSSKSPKAVLKAL